MFALAGPALYFKALNFRKVFLEIVPTWFILPVLAFAITYIIARYIYRPLKNFMEIRFANLSEHRFFRMTVIMSSCYVAFAIGSNNVANASGPISSMLQNELNLTGPGDMTLIMILSTLIVAPSFGIGSSLLGQGVVQTAGKEITTFGPIGATVIALVISSLLLFASVSRGIPTSLVQLNAAAIIALGIARKGWRPIMSNRVLLRMFSVWIIAPVFAFLLSWSLTVAANALGIL